MALILTEPFESKAAWTAPFMGIVAGGVVGNCLQNTVGSATAVYAIPTPSQSADLAVGFWFQVASIAASREIVQLGSDTNATLHVVVQCFPDGRLEVLRRPSTTLGVSATGLIAANTWYYLELAVRLSDTVGSAELRLGGTTRIGPLTGIDTKNAGTKTVFDSLVLTCPSPTGSGKFDELYLKTGELFAAAAAVKVWNGSAFVDGAVKVWNGSAWVDAVAVKTYNGSAWV